MSAKVAPGPYRAGSSLYKHVTALSVAMEILASAENANCHALETTEFNEHHIVLWNVLLCSSNMLPDNSVENKKKHWVGAITANPLSALHTSVQL